MKTNYKRKIIGALSVALLLTSTGAFAQKDKSVYDVIPGSGPKKRKTEKTEGQRLPDIVNGKDNLNDGGVIYKERRKNLPPGQAKKVYGGRATDYAPGQVKKHRHHKHWKKHHKGHHKNWAKGKHKKHKDNDD